jgi:ribosomal silencing factor RsfS
MELLIRDLIEKISDRKRKELIFIEQNKNTNINKSIMIATGKILEMNAIIHDLEELLRYYKQRE